MDSNAENVCCKSRKFCISMPDDCCVTEHKDFTTIINKVDHQAKRVITEANISIKNSAEVYNFIY